MGNDVSKASKTHSSLRQKNGNRIGTDSSKKPARDSTRYWESKETVVKSVSAQVEVYRNPQPTRVEEKNDKVVVFRTPTMRAKATVTIPPVPSGQVWTIGWVQSCHYMNFVNVYGALGFTSWEFPQLNLRMAGVNDSDGESYPFYGHEKEMCQIRGPVASPFKTRVE